MLIMYIYIYMLLYCYKQTVHARWSSQVFYCFQKNAHTPNTVLGLCFKILKEGSSVGRIQLFPCRSNGLPGSNIQWTTKGLWVGLQDL